MSYWATRELGMSLTDLTSHRLFGMKPFSISYVVCKREAIAPESNHQPLD